MLKLEKSLYAWDTDLFKETIKNEIECLALSALPINKCLSHSGHYNENDFSINVISVSDNDEYILVKINIFFKEMLANCPCEDDSEPMMTESCCEITFRINKLNAEVIFT